jgi:hypothetical protein
MRHLAVVYRSRGQRLSFIRLPYVPELEYGSNDHREQDVTLKMTSGTPC